MKNWKIGLLVLGLAVILGVTISGCTTTSTTNPNNSTTPAVPPSGTTAVNLTGSNANIGTSGGGNTLIITDQDNTALTNATIGNLSFEVWTGTGTTDTLVATITITELKNGANTGVNKGAVSLVLDKSGSMFYSGGLKLATSEMAAIDFIDAMGSGTIAGVINYDTTVSIEAAMTSDKDVLRVAATVESPYGGGTHIFDATSAGVTQAGAQSSTNYTRAVISMTDGQDGNSSKTVNQVTAEAIAAGIPIYTVGLFDSSSEASSYRAPLVTMAEQTTGTSESYYEIIVGVTNLDALTDLYTKFASAVANAYQVTFTINGTLVSGQTYVLKVILTYGSFTKIAYITFTAN